jgi:pimeloyl-CoA synthetase
MFNEEERKERIDDLMNNTLEAYINNGKQDFLTILVSEEKSMIEQAVKEFAQGVMLYCYADPEETKEVVIKLLKKYGIEI